LDAPGSDAKSALLRGCDQHVRDARVAEPYRFAFLLATPVILAVGVLKVPLLLGPAGARIHGQVALGVIVCRIAPYLPMRVLLRWFQTRSLTPFAIYCLAAGILRIVRFI
jgi:undecaprenyl-diphosphatase